MRLDTTVRYFAAYNYIPVEICKIKEKMGAESERQNEENGGGRFF